MCVLETERLCIEHLTSKDQAFIFELLNEPAFLDNIGDRGVHSLEDALGYIEKGPRTSYAKNGFGLYKISLKATGEAIGMAGLIKRDSLPDVDIGYAILERFWGQGFAYEAASAIMQEGRTVYGLARIVGIVKPGNTGSIRVLEKLGLRFEKLIGVDPAKPDTKLFG